VKLFTIFTKYPCKIVHNYSPSNRILKQQRDWSPWSRSLNEDRESSTRTCFLEITENDKQLFNDVFECFFSYDGGTLTEGVNKSYDIKFYDCNCDSGALL